MTKFNAKECTYKGVKFKSMFERDVFKSTRMALRRLFKLKSVDDERVSKHVAYEADYIKYTMEKAWYCPDFTLIKADGAKMFIETKGYYNARDRKKMRAVKKSNPEADIRMVFMKNGKVGKQMTYSRWCELNDFPYAFEKIPDEWLEECV